MINLISSINRNLLHLVLIGAIFLSTVIIGYATTYKNYSIIFFTGAIFLIFITLNYYIAPFILIFFIIAFSEWAVEYQLLPPQIMWIPELLCLLLFAKAIIIKVSNKEKINLFGIWIILGFITVSSVSLLYNKIGVISALLFFRLILRYYLLFLAVINLDFDDKSMKLINISLIFIFIIQLPLSVIKLFIYGYDYGEKSLGLSSHELSTIIPLIAIGFLLSYYFLYRKDLL